MSSALIEVQELTVDLEGHEILKSVSAEVSAGSLLAVIGPNGAGKSTLIRCIDGLLPLRSGRVLVAGGEVARMSRRQLARELAYVPQLDERGIDYRVRAFVEMGRYPHLRGWASLTPADREAVDRALELTETTELQQRLLSSLSGGERQRVSVAAALAQGGQILLLDEATSFLDYRHQVQLMELLSRLRSEQGLTIVAVTHDLNVTVAGSDQVLALAAGEVVFRGAPAALFEAETLASIFATTFDLVSVPGRPTPLVIPVGVRE